ncbi:hypothetical protein ACJRPK_12810 [Aquimarina sp. 2-A2]|uniref:hypothetical protein n=1 Tax=Aquimarina sp. 2-A2 TaxID=3382644 RepID=UPI00387EF932
MKKTLLFTLFFGTTLTTFSQSFSEEFGDDNLISYKVFEYISESDTNTNIGTKEAARIDNLVEAPAIVSETITIIKGLKNEEVHHYEHFKKLEKSYKTVTLIEESEAYTSF